ncbi:MAG: hypothetical protein V1823_05565 [Chloroflexota bacterium]
MRNKFKWHSLLLIGLVLMLATSVMACAPSAEEQEYSRIASLSERQAFQQSIKDLRTQGVSINFGSQPPYYGGSSQSVRLENNITAVNPTWQQLIDFLKTDQTDSSLYIPWKYTCAESTETLHNAAEKAGIRSAFVAIEFGSDTIGHALNAFYTVDLGWVFIDNTGVSFANLASKNLVFLLFGTHKTDPFAGWSRDSEAYLKIGSELGFVHISVANSSDYSFYEGWKSRSQAFDVALDQYNRDVQSFNDWVSGRVFYLGTPDALRMQKWSNELDARKVALDRDELALGPVSEPMGVVERIDIYF